MSLPARCYTRLSMQGIHRLSASEMARQVAARELSPTELVRAHLERISRFDPQLHAFVQVDEQGALQAAADVEERVRAGEAAGPLHGVPLSIKNSIEVKGLSFDVGTPLRRGVRGGEDAPLVRRLKAAGAIVLGVTNCPELLMAWETDNLLHGRTANPWDIARTAGGSSGGESAAIAAMLSAGGVGSDAGGSIRVPAHFTGICGLKPTPGRVPVSGHYPPSAGPFSLLGVVGPMARTVEDLELLFSVMAGADWGDPLAAPVEYRRVEPDAARRLRVGYFEDDGHTPVAPAIRAAVRHACDALRDAGFGVVEFRPSRLDEARAYWWNIFVNIGGRVVRDLYKGTDHELSPVLRDFLDTSFSEPDLSGEEVLQTWFGRDHIRTEALREMEEFPILICPPAAVTAFPHFERTFDVEGKALRYLDAWTFTEWFNLLGLPATVVPIHRDEHGLPAGVQIVGRPWREEEVLAVAREIDARFGFQPPAGY